MGRIVLVDDDDLMCKIVARTLAPFGHVVVSVRDGSDAIDALWEHSPDLAILDCALPGKTGLAILREIRDSAMFRDLPVLILTARRSEWHAKLALEAGANDYVRKPFEPSDLIAKIGHLLGGAARPGARATLLDDSRLADVRKAVGARQTDALLAMIETDIAERAFGIAALLTAGDLAGTRRAAHALRGASDGIGALDLARHCHAIEHGDKTDAVALTACATATIAAIARARNSSSAASLAV